MRWTVFGVTWTASPGFISRFSFLSSATWAAHSYVERSGDLDQCNGRVDDDGQYRYYTTTSFPYYLGCYRGDLLDDSGAGGPGGGMGPPPGA